MGAGWWACEFHLPHILANSNAEIFGVSRIGSAELQQIQKHFENLDLESRKKFQSNLRGYGYASKLDGIWGDRTLTAVLKFIENNFEFGEKIDYSIIEILFGIIEGSINLSPESKLSSTIFSLIFNAIFCIPDMHSYLPIKKQPLILFILQ